MKDGVVLAAPTVTGGSGGRAFSLTAECERLWPGAAIFTVNDLTAAGMRLVDDGMRDFSVITVGSGIGHKVFVDGQPLVGRSGRGGEIGHLRLDFSPDAMRCDCGGMGHVGSLASARGTIAVARRRATSDPVGWRHSLLAQLVEDPSEICGPAIATAFRKGDGFVAKLVADTARYLGQAVAAIHLDTGVEQFVLIGGFPRALGEGYRTLVASAAREASWDLGQDWDAMLALGPDDDDSALIGAGLLAAGGVPGDAV
jgi:glucokinase